MSHEQIKMKHQFKFMPMYWLDYHLDTEHLSTVEHGAYLLLLSYYWRSGGPIADDDELLSRVAKLSLDEWKPMKAKICRLFYFEDGHWRQKRVDREFEACRAIAERNRENVRKRWRSNGDNVVQIAEKAR